MPCPKCHKHVFLMFDDLDDSDNLYVCNNCNKMFSEDEVIHVLCPLCKGELDTYEDDFYSCWYCIEDIDPNVAIYVEPSFENDFSDDEKSSYDFEEDFSDKDDSYYFDDKMSNNEISYSRDNEEFDYQDVDYDSMVNNGDAICLNCTFWSVSPYGSAYGMICRKGNGQTNPDDFCNEFIQVHHFGNYGDSGQYQFDDTSKSISDKLFYWKNSR